MDEWIGPFRSVRLVSRRGRDLLESQACAVLREEIEGRFGVALIDEAFESTLQIGLALRRGIRGDGYRITSKRRAVILEARNERGLLYAAGKLLRLLHDGPEGITLRRGTLTMSPRHSHRGHEVSTYKYKDHWGTGDWAAYIRELALWGVNWIWSASLTSSPLNGSTEQTRRVWERHCKVQNEQSRMAHSLGLSFGIHSYANNVAGELVTSDIDRGGGSFVCPSTKRGRRLINASRKMLFERLEELDAIFTASHDPGGCPCQECSPWVETYIPLMEEQAGVARRIHPEVKFYISNQALSREENLWLFRYLRQERPDWLDGIVWGPQSRPLSELRRGVPRRYSILAFPDITHLIICQYPVRGIHQANALIHHRESPTYRPKAMARIFEETEALSQGSKPYSEGLHDDLNKAVWSSLDWGIPPGEAVREYCQWHFGNALADAFVQVIFQLEQDLKKPVPRNPAQRTVLELVSKASPLVPGREASRWRYRLLLLRTLLDRYIQLRLERQRSLESRILRILGEGKKEPGKKIDEALRLIRGDRKGREESLLGRRIRSLSHRLASFNGIRIPSVDRLNVDLANLAWIRAQLEGAKSLPPRLQEQALLDVVSYEDVGPHGFYDDCGNSEQEPHLLQGEDYFLEGLDPATRLSQRSMSYGRSEWDSDVVYAYQGLEGVAYLLSVTYLTNGRMAGSQMLLANDEILHGDLELPVDKPVTLRFRLRKQLLRGGSLKLIFRRGSRGRGPLVSEIRLQPDPS